MKTTGYCFMFFVSMFVSACGGVSFKTSAMNVSLEKGFGGANIIEIAQSSPEMLVQVCNDPAIRVMATELPTGSDIVNQSGVLIASAEHIGKIEQVEGDVVLFAASADADIDNMNLTSGNILICGMRIESVANHTGNLVVVGGEIRSINDSTGKIEVIR
jgi:hypothetical protein